MWKIFKLLQPSVDQFFMRTPFVTLFRGKFDKNKLNDKWRRDLHESFQHSRHGFIKMKAHVCTSLNILHKSNRRLPTLCCETIDFGL